MSRSTQLLPLFLVLTATGSAQAATWVKTAQEKGITIYTRDKPGSDIKEVKAIGTVDSAPHACMNVVEDLGHFKDFMPFTKESKILGREGDKVVFSYQFLSLPLINNRDYSLRIVDETPAAKPGEAPAYYKSSWTPANDKGPAPRDGVVRVGINTGHWRFDPLDDGKRTKITYYLFTDPGGMIPSFIANRANTQAIPDMFAAVRKQSKLQRYQKTRVAPKPAATNNVQAGSRPTGDTPGG